MTNIDRNSRAFTISANRTRDVRGPSRSIARRSWMERRSKPSLIASSWTGVQLSSLNR